MTFSLRHIARSALLAGVASAGLCVGLAPARAETAGLSDLIARLMPSVVVINSTLVEPTPATSMMNVAGQPSADSSPVIHKQFGSGFVIDADGLIMSNNHVIDGAADISVTFEDGTVAKAELVGATKIGDISVLKVTLNHKLTPVTFGNSTQLRVGEPVVAIGNPLGFGGTVTTGIISALNRNIMLSPFDDFIQTDASINHGNSGGPLFNLRGEVIGVNTAIISPGTDGGSVGLGFAIPAFNAQFVGQELIKYGHVRAGHLGVEGQDVTTEIAAAAGLPLTRIPDMNGRPSFGIIITEVPEGSAGKAGGLLEGDIVMTVAGTGVGDLRGFARLLAVQPLNQPVELIVWRRNAQVTLHPVVQEWLSGEQYDQAAVAHTLAQHWNSMDLGLKLEPLTEATRKASKLPANSPGVLVTSVAPFSVASDRGLKVGDVILKVQDDPVTKPTEVLGMVGSMMQASHSLVLLLVHSSAGQRWVPLPLAHS